MDIANTLSFTKKMQPAARIRALFFIVFVTFFLLAFIWANLVNEVRGSGKNYVKIRELREALEAALLVDAGIHKVRAEELGVAGGTGEERMRRIKTLKSEINSGFADIVKRSDKEQFKSLVLDTQAIWNAYARSFSRETLPSVQRDEGTGAGSLPTETGEIRFGNISGQIAGMIQALRSEIEGLEKSVNDIARSNIITALIASSVVILIALFLIWRILSGMKNTLLMQTVYARSLADGDLTGPAGTGTDGGAGELGDSLDAISDNFRSVLGKIRTALKELIRISRTISEISGRVVQASEIKERRVGETSAAIVEINASVKGVAQGVDSLSLSASENSSSILEMAASVEEVALNVENLARTVDDVSSSIVEMTAAIKQIGNSVNSLIDASSVTASSVMEMDSAIRQVEKNATDTSKISEEVRRDAEMGRVSVEATIKGMDEIRRASGITSEVIVTLSERANDIGAILSVIDEVAEQTNLLALNAAIIAAQAGEQGKGFAVVADEIKELADRTSSSTREIALLIKGVQEETRRAVEAINQAEKSIADGEQLSRKSGEALNKIVDGVEKATEQIGEIAHASVEQAKGSQMIRDAVEQVTDMIMQISSATQEQGKGSELIMSAVERMKVLTGQVRSSTREQSKVGTHIAQSTENITGMIQQIKRACDEQAKGSEQIVHAIEDIQRSTGENIESVGVLDEAFAGLSRQIEELDKEVRRFRIEAQAG
jgi:methyl-accepting chemotaxis protein